MHMRAVLVAALVLLTLVPCASADKIMLLTGELLSGTLANRDAVRAAPLAQPHFSLLLEESNELRRLDPQEIDYLVFEDEGAQEVVDLSSLFGGASLQTPRPSTQREQVPVRSTFTRGHKKPPSGVPLILVGAVTGGVGALVKFGGEKATVTEDSIDYQSKSYNATNYVLMVAGGVLVVGGIIVQMADSAAESQHAELAIELRPAPLSGVLGLGFGFTF